MLLGFKMQLRGQGSLSPSFSEYLGHTYPNFLDASHGCLKKVLLIPINEGEGKWVSEAGSIQDARVAFDLRGVPFSILCSPPQRGAALRASSGLLPSHPALLLVPGTKSSALTFAVYCLNLEALAHDPLPTIFI